MEDEAIVTMYWARQEEAIHASAQKYGRYCHAIAQNILRDEADAGECVNDTWLGAWNAMPTHRPANLGGFLGKITRRIAIKRWQAMRAEKRGGGETALVLEELEGCIASGADPVETLEAAELARVLDGFVRALPETERKVFLCRYWYMDPVASIAAQFGFSTSKVKSMLHRTRQRLREYLKKEDFMDDK